MKCHYCEKEIMRGAIKVCNMCFCDIRCEVFHALDIYPDLANDLRKVYPELVKEWEEQ